MKNGDHFFQPATYNQFNYDIPSPIYVNNTAPINNVPLIPQPLQIDKRVPSPVIGPFTTFKKNNQLYNIEVENNNSKNKSNTIYIPPIPLPQNDFMPTFTSPSSPISNKDNLPTFTSPSSPISNKNNLPIFTSPVSPIRNKAISTNITSSISNNMKLDSSKISPQQSINIASPTSINYRDLIPQGVSNVNYNPFYQHNNDLVTNKPIIPDNKKPYDLTTPQNVTATKDIPNYFNKVNINNVPFVSPQKSPYILSPQNVMSKFREGLSLSNEEKNTLIEEIKRQPTKSPSPIIKENDRKTDFSKLKISNYENCTLLEKAFYRNDFIEKFEKLKKPPYNFTIKNIDYENTPLEIMHLTYNSCNRTINKNYEVDQYFMILVVIWAGIEALSHATKFPIKGYTKFQIKRYQTYRSLLNGLGDTYTEEGEIVIHPSWVEDYSPLAKIFILSIGNVIFFVIYRFLSKSMSKDQADSVVDMLANKLYGEGEQKEINQIVNEMTGNKESKENSDSGFNFGNIIGGLLNGNGLASIGTILSSIMGGGNKEEQKVPNPVEVDIDMNSPVKRATYDDTVPILSPANMGFNRT